MPPPIFGIRPSGTIPQQYLHRARMFRNAAGELVDYVSGEQNWPKYALLTHAIELSLKAFVWQSKSVSEPGSQQPKNHDLRGWYDLAVQYGLEDDPSIAANVDILNDLHINHYTRYPQQGTMPDATTIADTTVDHLIFTFTQSINPR
jgi:hypothetical protein